MTGITSLPSPSRASENTNRRGYDGILPNGQRRTTKRVGGSSGGVREVLDAESTWLTTSTDSRSGNAQNLSTNNDTKTTKSKDSHAIFRKMLKKIYNPREENARTTRRPTRGPTTSSAGADDVESSKSGSTYVDDEVSSGLLEDGGGAGSTQGYEPQDLGCTTTTIRETPSRIQPLEFTDSVYCEEVGILLPIQGFLPGNCSSDDYDDEDANNSWCLSDMGDYSDDELHLFTASTSQTSGTEADVAPAAAALVVPNVPEDAALEFPTTRPISEAPAAATPPLFSFCCRQPSTLVSWSSCHPPSRNGSSDISLASRIPPTRNWSPPHHYLVPIPELTSCGAPTSPPPATTTTTRPAPSVDPAAFAYITVSREEFSYDNLGVDPVGRTTAQLPPQVVIPTVVVGSTTIPTVNNTNNNFDEPAPCSSSSIPTRRMVGRRSRTTHGPGPDLDDDALSPTMSEI